MPSAVRVSGVAIDKLIADLAAFPLNSLAGFRYAATQIGTMGHHRPTQRLWRAAERNILRETSGFQLDEFTTLRDRLWFGFLNGQDKLKLSRHSPHDRIQQEPPQESLHRYLRRLVERNLKSDGAVARPTIGPARRSLDMTGSLQSRLARTGWLWLVLALPADLLTAVVPGTRRVETVSPMLERMLADQGYAELHLHLGAAIEFPWLWIAVLQALVEPDCPANLFESPGADLQEGRHLAAWMLRAAIARYLLAWYLQGRFARPQVLKRQSLDDAVEKQLKHRRRVLERRFAQLAPAQTERREQLKAEIEKVDEALNELPKKPDDTASAKKTKRTAPVPDFAMFLAENFDSSFVNNVNGVAAWEIDAAIRPLRHPDSVSSDKNDFVWLQSVYRRLVRPRRRSATSLEDATRTDPISRFFRRGSGAGETPEQDFMRQGLAWLEELEVRDQSDPLFELFFWQVQRIRCLFYRFIVQDSNIPGLQWFLRFYSRIRTARDPFFDVELLLESAARVSGADRGLKSLEVRSSSDTECSSMFQFVERFGEQARRMIRQQPVDVVSGGSSGVHGLRASEVEDRARSSSQRGRILNTPSLTEAGLVIHFARDRGAGASKGLQETHLIQGAGDPSINRYRFAGVYRRFRQEAIPPGWLLENFPLSLQWLRGIDVCADEMGVPPWVLVPLFKFLRERSETASRAIQTRFDLTIPPMRTTVHAGEAFIHLLTGLRYIDESIECFDLREGDRLGHALALRIDSEEWCRRAGPTTMTLHDRLFDLVWEWTIRDRAFEAGLSDRRQFIEYEIQQHAQKMYAGTGDVPSIFELAQLMKDLRQTDGDHSRADGDPDPENLQFLIGFPDLDPMLARHRLFGVDIDRRLRAAYAAVSAGRTQKQGATGHALRMIEELHDTLQNSNHASSLQRRLQRLFTYLTDVELYHRGQTPITVNPFQAGQAIGRIQNALRRKVASRGIVIEINPTSNLLIGDLNDLRNAPFWRLQETSEDGSTRPVSLCLGSDDPLLFASDLRQEYQRLVDAMGMQGFSDDEARATLNRIREAGLEARFTLPEVLDLSITAMRGPVSRAGSYVRI